MICLIAKRITYMLTCIYVNYADEFHMHRRILYVQMHFIRSDAFCTLRRRVVRRVYTIFLRAWLKKMCLMCLCYSVLPYSFVLHCVKQRTFRFEKVVSRQQKIYIMKKVSCYTCACRITSWIYWIMSSSSSSSSQFSWFELLMSQLGRKMSLKALKRVFHWVSNATNAH